MYLPINQVCSHVMSCLLFTSSSMKNKAERLFRQMKDKNGETYDAMICGQVKVCVCVCVCV